MVKDASGRVVAPEQTEREELAPSWWVGLVAVSRRSTRNGWGRCVAELPWTRRACVNPADGFDGCCEECRDELNELERRAAWEEARGQERG